MCTPVCLSVSVCVSFVISLTLTEKHQTEIQFFFFKMFGLSHESDHIYWSAVRYDCIPLYFFCISYQPTCTSKRCFVRLSTFLNSLLEPLSVHPKHTWLSIYGNSMQSCSVIRFNVYNLLI